MVSFRQMLFTLAASTTALAAPTSTQEWDTKDAKFSSFQSVGLLAVDNPLVRTTQSGAMTYYLPGQGSGNGAGACGEKIDFSQPIVAISGFDYGGREDNPNNAPICGHWIKITGRESKKAAWAQVVDKCPKAECPPGFIDVSEVVFQTVTGAGLDAGRIQVDWQFVKGNGLDE